MAEFNEILRYISIMTMKARGGRISSDKLGIMTALTNALRSEGYRTAVGACIMNKDGRIISTGFNGLCAGYDLDPQWTREQALKYMVHAETNALSLIERGDGHTIFLNLSPCENCAQNIAAHGIKRVLYVDEYHRETSYKDIFDLYGIAHEKFLI